MEYDKERLIDVVHSKPALWDKRSFQYQNRNIKNKDLQDVNKILEYGEGCRSGYASGSKGKNNVTLFRAPKDIELLNIWERNIPRKDRKISSKDFVCALHFQSDDIVTHFEIEMPGGLIHKTTERKYPILRSRSIPSIFPNHPEYLTSSKQKRSAPKPRFSPISTKIKKTIPINIHNEAITQEHELQSLTTSLPIEIISEHNHVSSQGEFTVEDLHNIANKIVLPGNMWGMHQNPGKCTVFTQINDNFENEKIVHFSTTCLPNVILTEKSMYFPMVKSFEGLQNLLNDIHNLVICIGSNDNGIRSPECLGSLPSNNKNSKIKRCPKCNESRRKMQKNQTSKYSIKKKNLNRIDTMQEQNTTSQNNGTF